MKKIIVDIMGADNGPEMLIKGVLDAMDIYTDIGIIFVGNKDIINKYCTENERTEIIHTDDFISNNENPQEIFTGRDNCSIAISYKRLKEDDDCIGMLSAGSTGALLIGSICRLGLIKGLKTPALSSYLPVFTGNLVCLIDCGANIVCSAKDLQKFALMGNAFKESVDPEKTPRVALLSVGKEEGKGNPLTKEAYSLLKELPINFIGNIEGSDLVTDGADVIVTDGFSGNILLKSTEAAGLVARGIVDCIAKSQAKENDELIKTIKQALTLNFNFNAMGGATFLGTKKTVIKMHGSAVRETPASCIEQLLRLEKAGFKEKIEKALESTI